MKLRQVIQSTHNFLEAERETPHRDQCYCWGQWCTKLWYSI